MDLSTIKKNIENGLIRTTAEFQRDIMLMFQNAVMYNSSDHDVYHMAVEMQRDVLEQIQVKYSAAAVSEQCVSIGPQLQERLLEVKTKFHSRCLQMKSCLCLLVLA